MMVVDLGEVIKIISGAPFKSELFNENFEGLPLIRVRDVNTKPAGIYYSGTYSPEFLVDSGDLLVSMDGDFKCVSWTHGKGLLNQRVCKIVPDESVISRSYLRFFLPKALSDIHRDTTFTTVKHLSTKSINAIKIPLPPLDDQIRIAHLLSKVEGLIAQRKQHLQQLDELLKSVFLEMFGDPVRNEKNWDKEALGQLGILDRGVSKHRPRNAPELLGGKYPLIQTGDVSNSGTYIRNYKQTYSEIGLKQSKLWPSGTLCITIAANIAQTAILTFDACFPDSVVGFIPHQGKSNTLYAHSLFGFFQQILEKNAPAAAQKNINLKILRELEVPAPPIELQDHFATTVKKVEGIKARYQQSLAGLENLYGVVSQRAFKGELDLSRIAVPDLSTEPDIETQEMHTEDAENSSPFSELLEALKNPPDADYRILIPHFNAYLDTLDSGEFDLEACASFIQDHVEGSDPEYPYFLSLHEYETIYKKLIFDALADGRLEQTRNIIVIDGEEDFGNKIILQPRKVQRG